MKASFNYRYMVEYLPKRHYATSEQQADRQEVYDFKDGCASESTYARFIRSIRNMIGGGNTSNYCVCFIPASEHFKTVRRYSSLAERIRREIGCTCTINTITCEDHESGHIHGKTANPTEGFEVDSSDVRGKKVILIDDVITRGRTFIQTANLLLNAGATDVEGLFLAKTVNPDWRQVA